MRNYVAYFSDLSVARLEHEDIAKATSEAMADNDEVDLLCIALVGCGAPISEFSDDAIEAEYNERFGNADIFEAAHRAFDFMAEGDIDAAMDTLERAIPDLPPRYHAQRLGDLLKRARS